MNELWSALWRLLRDPRLAAALVLAASALVGFALILGAFVGARDFRLVVFQVPYLVSGGIGGAALIGLALSLLSVHLDRVESLQERRELASAQRATMRLVRMLTERELEN